MRFIEPFGKSEAGVECVNLSRAFEFADENEKKALRHLAKKMHAGLYCETFTIAEEREPVQVWLKMLETGMLKGQHIYVAFGRNLSSEEPDILGFAIGDIGGGDELRPD